MSIRAVEYEAAAWRAKRKVLLSALESVAEIAKNSDVELIVFKGPNLAGRLYRESDLRIFRDLDFLIRPEQLSRMSKALGEAGYKMTPGPYTGLDMNSCASWRLPLTFSPQGMAGIEIDLHSSPLSRVEAFYFPAEPLWERARSWKYGLKELADVDFLLLLFVHAMKHGYFDLLNFLDLEKASCREALCVHVDEVLAFASKYRFSTCVWASMEMGREWLGTYWPVAVPRSARVKSRLVSGLTRKSALAAKPWISERVQLLAVHPLLVDGWRKRLRCLRLLLLRPPSTIGPVPFKSGFLQNPWAFAVRLARDMGRRLRGE